jgi:hypothetical protein
MRGEEGDEKQIRRKKKKNKNHGSRITDYASLITHYELQITHYRSRDMSHMKHKTVCIKLFCKQKPLLKNTFLYKSFKPVLKK